MEFSKEKKTFEAVMANCDDQVTVRNLIHELVPEDVKLEIVRRFNEEVRARNERVKEFNAHVPGGNLAGKRRGDVPPRISKDPLPPV